MDITCTFESNIGGNITVQKCSLSGTKFGTTSSPPGCITAREHECLLWAGEGKTDWEISIILGISRSTVVKHVGSARRKLGATNKAHAIALAIRIQLLR